MNSRMRIQAVLLMVTFTVAAVTPVSAAAPMIERAPRTFAFEDIAHLSCVDAWANANKSVDDAIAMINALTAYLLAERSQTFPNSQEAGAAFGASIDRACKADPNQLFLAAIDSSLRQVVR